MELERTLIVLKPDAVGRGLAGEVIARIERAGIKLVGAKMRWMDAEFTRRHYFDLAERHGTAVYDATASFMQQGPVLAFVVEGVDVVANVRRLVGPTYPNQAAPGTIRGDFAHQSKDYSVANGAAVANLVHASGNVEEAKYEVELWFTADELFSYQTAASSYTC
ncbi:MAG TPA: nucleoside-diphosphate kinase [Mycobacteriales bacterium]|jgi:nucleoside-diphosphate kinase|nr:nucleoside-diphosphate kinase [Mycobacteriales bacterium]